MALKGGVVAVSCLVMTLAWQFDSQHKAIRMMWDSPILRPLMIAGGSYAAFSTFWSFWRFLLAVLYRPVPTVADHRLPKITIVVPAFNEGSLVGDTIRHLAKADYPLDRYEIIVCDDGSTDDTWHHIQAASAEVASKVKILPLHFDENRGKRWVLWEGFRRASGDIFITVDSDSLIEPDALKAVVSPLVEDEGVGAVAGNVRVLNKYDGIIPRMLSVRYVMTFDFKRAAQSVMGGGSVLCCAGALAAYRRRAVMPVLNDWLHQTYLGGHARAGEDHAMTNFILKQGYRVKFQRTARVYTKSPKTYTGLCKMFLRWGRSNVRETIHTASYVFTPFRPGLQLGMRYNFVNCAVGIVLPYIFLGIALSLSLAHPTIFGLKVLAACVTGGLFSLLFFAVRERSSECIFGVVYSFYVTLALCWVWPYALLTSHKSVWMTRVANKPGDAQPAIAMLPPKPSFVAEAKSQLGLNLKTAAVAAAS
ncbi:MAG: glycosyl transferase family 2 [Planctomycetota bacterium]|nr:MAG: glycosyl transferase family 2 [Planctomycetota bacterium]